jgi:transcriptional regulator
MYEPIHFRIDDREAVFASVRANPLGLLISQGEAGIIANAIPFLLEEEGEALFLRAHLARPNPHWQALAQNPDTLVVFQGLSHYITPEWYATKRESGKVVPTWNYTHVQMRGRASVREDRAYLHQHITALTHLHESGRDAPWAVTDAPDAFIEAQMRAIVGIEIRVDHWSGKFKLSQNRTEADRAGVVAGLSEEPDSAAQQMAAHMKAQAGKIIS